MFYGLNGYQDDSILKKIGNEKVITVLDYFYINYNLKGESLFCTENIILNYGLVPKFGKNKTVEQFKDILLRLHDANIIRLHNTNIVPKEFNWCELLIDLNDNYFTLDNENKNKILNYKSEKTKINNIKLLILYSYLLSRIYKRPDNERDIRVHGGKAQSCYPSYQQIHKDTGVAKSVIKKYIDILVELDLIRYGKPRPYYYVSKSKNEIYESNNNYVLYDEEGYWEDELKESIKAYEELSTDKVFVDNYENNNRSENGYIARITQLEKLGKASAYQIKKKNKILEGRQFDNT